MIVFVTCIQIQEGYAEGDNNNITLGNVSSGRSEEFAAIFLITLFLGLSLGLAVYAGNLVMQELRGPVCI